MENEQLKQAVACLGKALYDKKGKAKQIQPPQDNTTAGRFGSRQGSEESEELRGIWRLGKIGIYISWDTSDWIKS